MQQQKEVQPDYLEALVQLEVAKILEKAELGPSAQVGARCAALGRSFGQVWAQARERVLEQIS
jgi:hypothetical protein